MSMRALITALSLAALASTASAQAVISGSGYAQNFNGLGTTGTTPPSGWSVWTLPGSNTTFAAAIPAASVTGGTQVTPTAALGLFTAGVTTPANNNNGLNAAFNSSTADRLLATSPTTVAAGLLQLVLENQSGDVLNSIDVSYLAAVFSTTTTANEIPGYRFFYSTSGTAGAFTSVPALDWVPSTSAPVGTTQTVSGTIALASPLAVGSSIVLRWVDDNASQTSPDQIIGIDNVSVIPAPSTAALAALVGLGALRRRR